MRKILVIGAAVAALSAGAQQAWMDTSQTFHERAKAMVSKMTLDQKINQIGHQTQAVAAVGLPGYNYWNEALHGVARSGKATSFPSSKAMSATWNPQLVFDCAVATSDEARIYHNQSKKGLIYWCPTINMSRDPRWGRDEEDYGEDPFLTGTLGVSYVRGMQGDGQGVKTPYYKTIATIKHFAANNYEKGRRSTSSEVNERNLREYYLPAFEMCVKEGNVRSVMSAYNAVNGIPCGANHKLLIDILRGEWGFDGFVTSDCGAVDDVYQSGRHHYVATAEEACAVSIQNGEDLNCGSTFQQYCKSAIHQGLMTEADIDSALVRVLEARFSVGEFDTDVPWNNISADRLECEDHVNLAYKAAQQSIVLLKNDNNFLPLDRAKSVAVIGPLGREVNLGGYSGSPTVLVNPLEGIAEKIGFEISDGTVKFVDFDGSNVTPGNKRLTREANGSSGNVGYINNGDWISFSEIDFGSGRSKADFLMAGKSSTTTVNVYLDKKDSTPEAVVTVKPSGSWSTYSNTVIDLDPALFSGKHKVYFEFTFTGGSDKYAANAATVKFYDPAVTDPLQADGPLYYVKGCSVTADGTSGDSSAGVGGVEGDDYVTEIDRAVAIARKADYVVFVGGTNLAVSDESNDRKDLALPGDQQKLLEAVYAANPNVVLVLETCGSMSINWAEDNVPAIVEAWYGGQMQGKAIADVLYGDFNPCGKLTSTWYDTDKFNLVPLANQSYNINQAKLTYMYHDKTPLYPFGYGLSYTAYDYSDMEVSTSELGKDETATVSLNVTNTGSRDGAEIVQLYVSYPSASVSRPAKQLVGFVRAELAAGETKRVEIPFRHEQLAYFNTASNTYDVEEGKVELLVGASSADIRLRGELNARGAVVKQSYLSGVDEVVADTAVRPALVYDLNGWLVGSESSFDNLPAGIYIVNGLKVKKN